MVIVGIPLIANDRAGCCSGNTLRLSSIRPRKYRDSNSIRCQVGFVVDKVALGQVFSEYFGFPCQSSFHQLFHNHPNLSSGAVQ
jgi:hypothetical protein